MDRPIVGDARFSFLASSSRNGFFSSATVFGPPRIENNQIVGRLPDIRRVNSIHLDSPNSSGPSERAMAPLPAIRHVFRRK